MTTDGKDPYGFEIAGPDSLFVPANTKIIKNKIILYADKIEFPKYVRYAFTSNPKVNIVNEIGLPAFAFRTDRFFVEHQERMPQNIERVENSPTLKFIKILNGELTDWHWEGAGIENDLSV